MSFFRVARRSLPVYPSQLKKTAVEPGSKEVARIGIEQRELEPCLEGVERLLAHADQGRHAAFRHVHPSQHFLARGLRAAGESSTVSRSARRGSPAPPRRTGSGQTGNPVPGSLAALGEELDGEQPGALQRVIPFAGISAKLRPRSATEAQRRVVSRVVV